MGCAAGSAAAAAVSEARLREESAQSRAEALARQLEESEQERNQLQYKLKALEGSAAELRLDDVRTRSASEASASSRKPRPEEVPQFFAPAAAATPRSAAGTDSARTAAAAPGEAAAAAGPPGDVTDRHRGSTAEHAATNGTLVDSLDFVLPGRTACEDASPESTARHEPSSSSSGTQKLWTGTGNAGAPGDDPPTKHLSPQTMDLPEVSGEELLRKLTDEEDSTASTCTTVMRMLCEPSLPCHQCSSEGMELFLDHSDMNRYCEQCWLQFYGQLPSHNELLVPLEVAEIWSDRKLERAWSERKLQGWPPAAPLHPPTAPESRDSEVWSNVRVRLRRDVVGTHAREQKRDRQCSGCVLAGRYRVQDLLGEGHFTRAFAAVDLVTGNSVCLKRHHGLSVDALTDLMVLSRRLEDADTLGHSFPRLIDAFYDIVGYTVESIIDGKNCIALARAEPGFFRRMENLRVVAQGALAGLAMLDRAGVVHNDMKPDNLIWVEGGGAASSPRSASSSGPRPHVRIVDFGCARLDRREEPGRNWSLAEGGAGHLGKWSPEMVLRLPITHRGDVWGLAISLSELHCGRFAWCHESDTAEVVLAQSLGLCGHREGVPASLLRRSPLDVRKLYTPAPRHWPVRRGSSGQLQVLQPLRWGLEAVLGGDWGAGEKRELGDLLRRALVLDAEHRPSAAELLETAGFVSGA